MRVTNDIPLGCPLFLPVHTINRVQTLKASDATLVAKYKNNIKQPEYLPLRTDDAGFGIKHYAGEVQYDAAAFLEKNRDTLATALVRCCQSSSNELVKEIYNATISDTGHIVVKQGGGYVVAIPSLKAILARGV
jgi:myosin heavy subunit